MKRLRDSSPDRSPSPDHVTLKRSRTTEKNDRSRTTTTTTAPDKTRKRTREHTPERSLPEPRQARRTTAWAPVGHAFMARKEEAERKLHKRQCLRKFEYSHLESFKRMQNSGRQRLESYERAVRFYFAHSKMKLGEMQRKLVDVYMAAALKKFFNTDLVGELKFLAQKFLIEELNDAVAVLFPYVSSVLYTLALARSHFARRRSGKTEGSAWFIAIMAVSQPDWYVSPDPTRSLTRVYSLTHIVGIRTCTI
jgi:hypothetical protein